MSKLDSSFIKIQIGNSSETHIVLQSSVLHEDGDNNSVVLEMLSDLLYQEALRIKSERYIDTLDNDRAKNVKINL